jgi:hypothetical protein
MRLKGDLVYDFGSVYIAVHTGIMGRMVTILIQVGILGAVERAKIHAVLLDLNGRM